MASAPALYRHPKPPKHCPKSAAGKHGSKRDEDEEDEREEDKEDEDEDEEKDEDDEDKEEGDSDEEADDTQGADEEAKGNAAANVKGNAAANAKVPKGKGKATATATATSSTAGPSTVDVTMGTVSGQDRIYQTRDAANLASIIGDRMATENLKSQAIADAANLGFCAFQILEPYAGIVWGMINSRELIQPAIKRILDGFKENGMQSSLPERVIRIAVKKSWISTKLVPTTSGKDVLHLPLFELTDKGVEAARKGLIIPYSGNHRRAALFEHKKATEKSIKLIEREIKKLAPKKNARNTKNAIPTDRAALELKEKTEYLEEMKTWLDMCHLWGAQIYDLGEFVRHVFQALSLTYLFTTDELNKTGTRDIHDVLAKNENLAIQPKTEEEKVVTWTRKLVNARQKDIEKPPAKKESSKFLKQLKEARAWSSKRSSRFNNLFQAPHAVQYLMDLFKGGDYFMKSKLIRQTALGKLMKHHGGAHNFNVFTILR